MATPFDRGARTGGGPGSGILSAVPNDPRSAGLSYELFYGLHEKPFSLTSDARFFYHSRSHAPAFDDLLNAVKRRESLTVLTGDIGTGKTTLCRALLEDLDRKTFSAFVSDPFASRADLLKMLLTDFGVVSAADVTAGRLRDASRTELTYLLRDFLGTLAPIQAFAVVFIDEAQNLSLPLLEELRILSDADGQLQVVLVGQLELGQKLQLPAMRQLHQRVSACCRLQPLDLAGVAGYISHRLHRAGGSADRISYSADAVELVYELSAGVPRVINKVCDRALRAAYGRRVGSIDRELVQTANSNAAMVMPGPAPIAAAPPPASSILRSTAPEALAPEPCDPLDAWLNSIEDRAVVNGDGLAARPRTTSIHSDATPRSAIRPRFRVRIGYVRHHNQSCVTPTYVPRKWTRRLELLAFSLILLLVALMIGPSAWDVGSDAWSVVKEEFGASAPSPLPVRQALHPSARLLQTTRAQEPARPQPSAAADDAVETSGPRLRNPADAAPQGDAVDHHVSSIDSGPLRN